MSADPDRGEAGTSSHLPALRVDGYMVPKGILLAIFGAFLTGAGGGITAGVGTYVEVQAAKVEAKIREESRVARELASEKVRVEREAAAEKVRSAREQALSDAMSAVRGEVGALSGKLQALTSDRITSTQADRRHAALDRDLEIMHERYMNSIREHERLPAHPQTTVMVADILRRLAELEKSRPK